MIFDSLGVFGQSNPSINHDNILLMIYESLGLFGLSNPTITRDTCLLMISESPGAVCAVESICHT
jgi:hypothetical protein